MIDPRLLQDMAVRIKARVTSVPVGHGPMLTRPEVVASVIVETAESVAAAR